jgi:acyl carrier protein
MGSCLSCVGAANDLDADHRRLPGPDFRVVVVALEHGSCPIQDRPMTRDQVHEKLASILGESFAIPREKVTAEATFRGTLGMDSLDIVDLVYFLQKAFDFEADLDDYRDLHTVAKLIDFIEAQKAA